MGSKKIDASVAKAVVAYDGLHRHYLIVQYVESGLLEVGFQTDVPVLAVSLTLHHFQPTTGHMTFYFENLIKKDREAAHAPLAACNLHSDLKLPLACAVA